MPTVGNGPSETQEEVHKEGRDTEEKSGKEEKGDKEGKESKMRRTNATRTTQQDQVHHPHRDTHLPHAAASPQPSCPTTDGRHGTSAKHKGRRLSPWRPCNTHKKTRGCCVNCPQASRRTAVGPRVATIHAAAAGPASGRSAGHFAQPAPTSCRCQSHDLAHRLLPRA